MSVFCSVLRWKCSFAKPVMPFRWVRGLMLPGNAVKVPPHIDRLNHLDEPAQSEMLLPSMILKWDNQQYVSNQEFYPYPASVTQKSNKGEQHEESLCLHLANEGLEGGCQPEIPRPVSRW
jgi:hypothetical protein